MAHPGWRRRLAKWVCCYPWGLRQVQPQAHPAGAAGRPEKASRAVFAQDTHSLPTLLHLSHQSLQER